MMLGLALAWAVILAGCWLGWQLLWQNGRFLLRLDELENRLNELEFGGADGSEGLPLSSEAPAFELPDLMGERKSLAQFLGQPLLLIFFNPDCGFCREMMPKLAVLFGVRRQAERDAALDAEADTVHRSQSAVAAGAVQNVGGLPSGEQPMVLILTTGDAEKNRQFFAVHKVGFPVLLQKETEVATAYQANGTPSGYLISAEGKIASQLTMGAEALLALANEPHSSRREEAHPTDTQPSTLNPQPDDQSLVTSAARSRFSNRSLARSRIKRDGLKAGTPAPDFRLPRLDGRGDLSLEELRGRRVLLVFSSPHCGPCDALAAALEKFYREHGTTGHPLTVSPSEGERGNLSEI